MEFKIVYFVLIVSVVGKSAANSAKVKNVSKVDYSMNTPFANEKEMETFLQNELTKHAYKNLTFSLNQLKEILYLAFNPDRITVRVYGDVNFNVYRTKLRDIFKENAISVLSPEEKEIPLPEFRKPLELLASSTHDANVRRELIARLRTTFTDGDRNGRTLGYIDHGEGEEAVIIIPHLFRGMYSVVGPIIEAHFPEFVEKAVVKIGDKFITYAAYKDIKRIDASTIYDTSLKYLPHIPIAEGEMLSFEKLREALNSLRDEGNSLLLAPARFIFSLGRKFFSLKLWADVHKALTHDVDYFISVLEGEDGLAMYENLPWVGEKPTESGNTQSNCDVHPQIPNGSQKGTNCDVPQRIPDWRPLFARPGLEVTTERGAQKEKSEMEILLQMPQLKPVWPWFGLAPTAKPAQEQNKGKHEMDVLPKTPNLKPWLPWFDTGSTTERGVEKGERNQTENISLKNSSPEDTGNRKKYNCDVHPQMANGGPRGTNCDVPQQRPDWRLLLHWVGAKPSADQNAKMRDQLNEMEKILRLHHTASSSGTNSVRTNENSNPNVPPRKSNLRPPYFTTSSLPDPINDGNSITTAVIQFPCPKTGDSNSNGSVSFPFSCTKPGNSQNNENRNNTIIYISVPFQNMKSNKNTVDGVTNGDQPLFVEVSSFTNTSIPVPFQCVIPKNSDNRGNEQGEAMFVPVPLDCVQPRNTKEGSDIEPTPVSFLCLSSTNSGSDGASPPLLYLCTKNENSSQKINWNVDTVSKSFAFVCVVPENTTKNSLGEFNVESVPDPFLCVKPNGSDKNTSSGVNSGPIFPPISLTTRQNSRKPATEGIDVTSIPDPYLCKIPIISSQNESAPIPIACAKPVNFSNNANASEGADIERTPIPLLCTKSNESVRNGRGGEEDTYLEVRYICIEAKHFSNGTGAEGITGTPTVPLTCLMPQNSSQSMKEKIFNESITDNFLCVMPEANIVSVPEPILISTNENPSNHLDEGINTRGILDPYICTIPITSPQNQTVNLDMESGPLPIVCMKPATYSNKTIQGTDVDPIVIPLICTKFNESIPNVREKEGKRYMKIDYRCTDAKNWALSTPKDGATAPLTCMMPKNSGQSRRENIFSGFLTDPFLCITPEETIVSDPTPILITVRENSTNETNKRVDITSMTDPYICTMPMNSSENGSVNSNIESAPIPISCAKPVNFTNNSSQGTDVGQMPIPLLCTKSGDSIQNGIEGDDGYVEVRYLCIEGENSTQSTRTPTVLLMCLMPKNSSPSTNGKISTGFLTDPFLCMMPEAHIVSVPGPILVSASINFSSNSSEGIDKKSMSVPYVCTTPKDVGVNESVDPNVRSVTVPFTCLKVKNYSNNRSEDMNVESTPVSFLCAKANNSIPSGNNRDDQFSRIPYFCTKSKKIDPSGNDENDTGSSTVPLICLMPKNSSQNAKANTLPGLGRDPFVCLMPENVITSVSVETKITNNSLPVPHRRCVKSKNSSDEASDAVSFLCTEPKNSSAKKSGEAGSESIRVPFSCMKGENVGENNGFFMVSYRCITPRNITDNATEVVDIGPMPVPFLCLMPKNSSNDANESTPGTFFCLENVNVNDKTNIEIDVKETMLFDFANPSVPVPFPFPFPLERPKNIVDDLPMDIVGGAHFANPSVPVPFPFPFPEPKNNTNERKEKALPIGGDFRPFHQNNTPVPSGDVNGNHSSKPTFPPYPYPHLWEKKSENSEEDEEDVIVFDNIPYTGQVLHHLDPEAGVPEDVYASSASSISSDVVPLSEIPVYKIKSCVTYYVENNATRYPLIVPQIRCPSGSPQRDGVDANHTSSRSRIRNETDSSGADDVRPRVPLIHSRDDQVGVVRSPVTQSDLSKLHVRQDLAHSSKSSRSRNVRLSRNRNVDFNDPRTMRHRINRIMKSARRRDDVVKKAKNSDLVGKVRNQPSSTDKDLLTEIEDNFRGDKSTAKFM